MEKHTINIFGRPSTKNTENVKKITCCIALGEKKR